MEDFGIKFRPKDKPLRINWPKRVTCGKGGKYWYRLSEFRPDAGGCFIVGRYGCYKTGESEKVEVDWTPLKEAERERMRAERLARDERDRVERERLAAEAAMSAAELWRHGSRTGESGYFKRKGVEGEACRYMRDGSILLPLIRYDLPREEALRGVQRIWSSGRKLFTEDFSKPGCCVRLGDVDQATPHVILACEGYATGLSLRMAIERTAPVFVTLDCYNLQGALEILRGLYPEHPILICADDDWATAGNPGRTKAKQAAKAIDDCHFVWPIFPAGVHRSSKDTDFNDLHRLAGLSSVSRQVTGVLDMILRGGHGR